MVMMITTYMTLIFHRILSEIDDQRKVILTSIAERSVTKFRKKVVGIGRENINIKSRKKQLQCVYVDDI